MMSLLVVAAIVLAVALGYTTKINIGLFAIAFAYLLGCFGMGLSPGDIINNVPESYLLGDRAVYIDAFMAAKGALSPDGSFPAKGADTALRALASVDAELAKAKLDLNAVYTNAFVQKANAKYPKG